MANIKSAKKRILVNRTKAARNKSIKSSTKTSIKKVYAAIESGDKAAAQAALLAATSTIDKAATKGVYHKNNAFQKGFPSFQGCKPDGIRNRWMPLLWAASSHFIKSLFRFRKSAAERGRRTVCAAAFFIR